MCLISDRSLRGRGEGEGVRGRCGRKNGERVDVHVRQNTHTKTQLRGGFMLRNGLIFRGGLKT